MAFTVAIAGSFGWYLMQQSSLSPNLKQMDFWGMLMIGNVAVILAVIMAFWFSAVNLIDTLWTFLFLTPITLFIFNKGLAGSASCEIPEGSSTS